VCGAFSADNELKCGVCGNSLSRQSSLDSSVAEEEARDLKKREADDLHVTYRRLRASAFKAALALIAVVCFLVLGIVSVVSSGFGNFLLFTVGVLSLPIGFWMLANLVFGGLGAGSWRRFWDFKMRYRAGYTLKIAEEVKEKVSKESVRESMDVRREREDDQFD
jgi:hypothetical protein